MTSADHFVIELVIQTASGVLTGRYGAKEAVTLLASQGPQSRGRAHELSEREPEQAGIYAELLGSIGAALAAMDVGDEEAGDLRAVIQDIDRLIQALADPGIG